MAVESGFEWAWKTTLANVTLETAYNGASTRAEKAEAKQSFDDTMNAMLPDDIKETPQFEYYTALETLNNTLYASSSATDRNAAMTTFLESLAEIDVNADE